MGAGFLSLPHIPQDISFLDGSKIREGGGYVEVKGNINGELVTCYRDVNLTSDAVNFGVKEGRETSCRLNFKR